MIESTGAAVAHFDRSLREWTEAACDDWGYPEPEGSWYDEVGGRLPSGLRASVGMGLLAGAVRIVGGHRFTLAGLQSGKGPYAFFSRSARQRPAPNWEYFVQVAEYARLHAALDGSGLTLSFEDELMDVTVRDGEQLLWCIEVKEKADQLQPLLDGIQRHAEGVDVEAPDRHDDPLRKAKYIARARPQFLSLVAIGRRLDFSVEYLSQGAFQLIPDLVPLP